MASPAKAANPLLKSTKSLRQKKKTKIEKPMWNRIVTQENKDKKTPAKFTTNGFRSGSKAKEPESSTLNMDDWPSSDDEVEETAGLLNSRDRKKKTKDTKRSSKAWNSPYSKAEANHDTHRQKTASFKKEKTLDSIDQRSRDYP